MYLLNPSLILFAAVVLPSALSFTTFNGGNIEAGVGYSSETLQIVAQPCFNASIASMSQEQAYLQIDSAISYAELENIFGLSVGIGGKYGIFSAEAKVSYDKSILDKDYSLSLNYYIYMSNNVAVTIGFGPLTEVGQFYYNNGNNPYFSLLCGDHFISSYQQGALLSFALNIQFRSSHSNQIFKEKAGFSFKNIVSATQTVKTVCEQNNLKGLISIEAFQMGGDPSKLSNILNKDKDGNYYILSCDLSAMANCIQAANGILDYARNEFSEQVSFQENIGLTPLGITFTRYTPTEYVGLMPSPVIATPDVLQARQDLYKKYLENQYYLEKTYSLLDGVHPLFDDFRRAIVSISTKAKANIDVLMRRQDGALDCLTFPQKCINIAAAINADLRPISEEELKVLSPIKYTYHSHCGWFYNKGREEADLWPWEAVLDKEWVNKCELDYMKITGSHYVYQGSMPRYQFWFEGDADSSGMGYYGKYCTFDTISFKNKCTKTTEPRKISPYYFEPFKF